MIDVVRIAITKDELRRLSVEERAMLLLLGHAANQLAMLTKLVAFASNWRGYAGPIDEQVCGAQTQMFARQSIGVSYEAWRLIHQRFLSRPLGRDYRPLLNEAGQAALFRLSAYFGKPNAIEAVRNSFAFHNPHDDEVESAFDRAPDDAGWCWYLSEANINSFYFMSDVTITYGILNSTGIANHLEAHEKVIGDVKEISAFIVDFALAFTEAILAKHFPNRTGEVVERITNAPNVFGVKLPFYVEVPGGAEERRR